MGEELPRIARKVIQYILDNFSEEIVLDDLAQQAGMSKFNFCRRFQIDCGISPMRWLWDFRTLLAGEFINQDPSWSLTDVAFACGFTSSAHFSRAFKKVHGKSPSTYRKEARSNQVSPTVGKLSGMYGESDILVNKAARAAFC
jgi:AraC-like DNA-binding protein